MQAEINTMYDRKVWELVKPPEGVKLIGNRWVFTLKHDQQKNLIFKARLVAQGFLQRKGESYDEVFSPVVNFSIIRFFFAVFVSYFKWEHCQLDVKAAYLYAKLDKLIYMRQPQGFEDPNHPEYICKLNKALYGLHQSGRQWFFEIHTKLESLGFESLQWVNCVYTYRKNVILLLYVDDIVLLGKTRKNINEVIEIIKKNFEIKIMGKTSKLLGVQFEERNNNLTICQQDYIEKMYERFEKFKIPITSLPISKGVVLNKQQCPTDENTILEMKKYPYRSLIGILSFISSRTRPDVTYITNVLSRFQENPAPQHWSAALKTLGYLRGTSHLKLNLSNVHPLRIEGFTDAAYADCDDRTSTAGHLIYVGQAPILWRTFKQKQVSLSTMEAEFCSMTEAAKEITWISRIVSDCVSKELISDNLKIPKVLLTDSTAAMFYAKSPVENSRTKHISVKFHFIRNLLYEKLFELKHVRSEVNYADIMTKPVTKNSLKFFNDKMFT